MMTDDIRQVLAKYENMWLNMSGQSMIIDASSQDDPSYIITQNLLSKSLLDIEKYATDYPIWRDTADLGMSGSLHYWSVEFDRIQLIALAKQLSLVGSAMIQLIQLYRHSLDHLDCLGEFSLISPFARIEMDDL
jgi:hypothetical protein